MPRVAATLLIVVVTATGCSQSTAKPLRADHVSATTSTTRAHRLEASPPVTTTSAAPPRETTTTAARTALAVASPSAEDAARSLVQRLIDQDTTVPGINADLWAADLDGGSIVQVTTLTKSAGRADVAVSAAFPTAVGAAIAEPIGIRVQLHTDNGIWVVDGIGYL